MDATIIASVIAGILAILAVLFPGILSIIAALKKNTEITVAGQEAVAARAVIRDNKIQEIHLLVNSRLLTVLRLLVVLTKKEADRTNSADDIQAYNEALKELQQAEAASKIISKMSAEDLVKQEQDAVVAEQKVKLLSKEVA